MNLQNKYLCQSIFIFRLISFVSLLIQLSIWQQKSSALDENKTWLATFSAGFGRVRFMDGNEINILHSKIDFLFKPIDSEKPLELKFVLLTQSPLREDDGFIKFPIDERDFAQISEAWLRYQIFKNLEFKFGSFPDDFHELTPKTWPYYSLRVKIDPIKDENFFWQVLARQDLFGVYAREMNSSIATDLERTRLESRFNFSKKFEKNQFIYNLNSHYEQFSDPDSTLSSLSIGRGEYIVNTITNREQKYRIIDINTDLTFSYHDFLKAKLSFNSWRNISANTFGTGYLYGVESSISDQFWNFSVGYWYFLGEQSSIPASSISSYYYPGFKISSLHLSGGHTFSENWNTKLEYRYQQSSPYGQDISPNVNPGNIPVIPLYKMYFILEYAIGAS
ncbi:hypothetical protein [Fluviispira multicolorata]|uniref:Uncharacterized protein n=1 Tax=Fluviispira multicolorata TaxID=2654512 RepID=A0A833JCU1_9BACT|nr:hypothetical protein [Fluviispira multicolorata]KAB8029847.1 hypothetical protein GCL57_09930 [Fluviispira multicolorata]